MLMLLFCSIAVGVPVFYHYVKVVLLLLVNLFCSAMLYSGVVVFRVPVMFYCVAVLLLLLYLFCIAML